MDGLLTSLENTSYTYIYTYYIYIYIYIYILGKKAWNSRASTNYVKNLKRKSNPQYTSIYEYKKLLKVY